MLSNSERRRWQEIESMLADDDIVVEPELMVPDERRPATARRRAAAIAIAVAGVAVTVGGLALTVVPVAVLGICLVGAGAFVWTWR